jgi:FecR protein.
MKQIKNQDGRRRRFSSIHPVAGLLGVSVAVLVVILSAYAVQADDDSGPGPMGAARLSSVEGQVRLTQEGQVIADSAPVNAPLFAGTRIETGEDGKAEIQFDDGSVARVSPNSALTLQAVGGDGGPGTDLALDNGLAYFELQGNDQNATRVLFGDALATVTGFTVLRVRMDTPPGELAVFSGNAHIERGNAISVDLRGGESITLDGVDPNRYNLAESIEPDSWDAWNSDRDQELSANATDQTSASGNFVNSDNPNAAWNDLDANGSWYDVPGQGYVWSPYVAATAGWDPYGCGHWMWTPQFGYVWVSCANWGYLPYSCGSWNFYDGFGWGWAPGYGSCVPWWRRGVYVGWNIGNGPSWYHPMPRPVLRHPRDRKPVPIIPVNRHPDGGPNQLPPRGRNTPVNIAGQRVEPLRPIPGHNSYVRSSSGFVYHPVNGNQNRRDGGIVQNDRQPIVSRPVYEHNGPGGSYVREANPQPTRTYTPPSQGRGADHNDNSAPIITQPGRIVVPPSPSRQEPSRTYTPPQQQPQPQPRTEPSRQYTPPPQPRQEPSRPYTPPPTQRNPGAGNSGGGSFSRPASPPSGGGGGGAPSGGVAPHGGGGGVVHH